MGIFEDFVPAHQDPGALGQGFRDFVPAHKPQVQELSKEEQLRLQRIQNLARAREIAKAKREAK